LGAQGNLRLKKFYGQHLLVSPGILKRIVEFARLNAEDIVVEIGPGTGQSNQGDIKGTIKRTPLLRR
jgi:Dimethyladenosine transferase (rRNA methylation)